MQEPAQNRLLINSIRSLLDDLTRFESVVDAEAEAVINVQPPHSMPQGIGPNLGAILVPRSITLSTKILLMERYYQLASLSGSATEAEIQMRAFDGFGNLSRRIVDMVTRQTVWASSLAPGAPHLSPGLASPHRRSSGGTGSGSEVGDTEHDKTVVHLSHVSPLALDALYSAANKLGWILAKHESCDKDIGDALTRAKGCLERLSMRWRVADEYLHILDGQNLAILPVVT